MSRKDQKIRDTNINPYIRRGTSSKSFLKKVTKTKGNNIWRVTIINHKIGELLKEGKLVRIKRTKQKEHDYYEYERKD